MARYSDFGDLDIDICTPVDFGGVTIDDVHHGHDSLLAGADFSSIRAAIDDEYGPHRYDLVDRMIDSLERRGREWKEPPTYEEVTLPSLKWRAIHHRMGVELGRRLCLLIWRKPVEG
jgi:hypothetical protein